MAAQDLQLRLTIGADGSVAVDELNRVEREISDIGESGQQAGQQAAAGLNVIGSVSDQIAGAVRDLGKTLGAYLTIEGLTNLAGAMLDAAQRAEDLKNRLDFAVGSAEAGDAAFDKLAALSHDLGISNNALVESYIRLKNLGLDPTNEALEAYANVAAATGKTTNDFVEAVADAITGEFERLKEFGVKASVEGDQVVLAFRGQTTSINNDAASIEQALIRIGQVEFAGAVSSQAQNLSTSLDQMGEAVDLLLARIATDSGAVDATRQWADAIAELAQTLAADAVPRTRDMTAEMAALNLAVDQGRAAWEKLSNPIASAVGLIIDKGPGAIRALSDWVAESKNLNDTTLALARRTAELATELDTTKLRAVELTEQQRLLAEQNAGLDQAQQSAAASAEQQAAALEELRNKQDAEHQTAIARLETAADLAKAYGNEAEALRLAAEARQLALDAAQQAQQIAQAELESAQARLANLQAEAQAQGAMTAAMREQLDAARVLVEEKRQAMAESQAAAQAADAEARAAKLAAETYGDQSEQLDELTASYQRLQVEADKNAKAIEAGADAAERLAGAQKDAAEKAAAYADALKRGADDAGRYAQASLEANEQVALLTDTIKKGESAQARDADLKRDLAEAAAKMEDALNDATAAIDRQIASMERDNDIAQAKIDLQIKQLEREQALAEARGDSAKAAQIALDIAQLEVSAAEQSAQAQYAQAEALAQKADMAERAAQADGVLTDEERDIIDALRDSAEMAKIEAQSMDVSTQSKEDNAKAAEKAADATRDQASASRENTTAQNEEADALERKKKAQAEYQRSADSLSDGGSFEYVLAPETLADQNDPGAGLRDQQATLQQLQSYLESWDMPSANVGATLDEIQRIWDEKYAADREAAEQAAQAAREAEAAATASRQAAEAERIASGEAERAARERMGLDPIDTNATSSASTSAQPVSIDTRSIEASITSALQNMSAALASGGSTININIEGVLDINDSATLDSLARKLKPIFADLERRGY